MPPNSYIKANIYNINSDIPKPDDKFFVDTNVWYWMTYQKASMGSADPYQLNSYPDYIQVAIEKNCSIFHCPLNFSELAHIIERTEKDIYNKLNNKKLNLKKFRYQCAKERSDVINEIQSVWNIVKDISIGIDVEIDAGTVSDALQNLRSSFVDSYDAFQLELIKGKNLKLLTDDYDMATIDGIEVFTANANVISEASISGKLQSR